MSDEPLGSLPPPRTLERIQRPKQSPWPLLIALVLLVLLIAGAFVLLFHKPPLDEPWRINYPGVEWIRGKDSNTQEGKRYLQAEVRFDVSVLSASEFQPFLGELVKHTKNVYFFYHIRALNKRGQHVLDGVAREDGIFSITTAEEYEDQ